MVPACIDKTNKKPAHTDRIMLVAVPPSTLIG
jgi:hypothetical protein